MSVRPALALGLCFSLAACATTAPLPDKPQIVQLSLSGSLEPCDWSGQYEPIDVPDQWALGATYWPHTMPRTGFRNRPKTAPLAFYGAHTRFSASETSPILCLRLFRRPSTLHEGLAPVAVLEIRPEGEIARISALRLDPKITRLDLGFIQENAIPPLNATMIGGQLVQSPPEEGAAVANAPLEHRQQRLSLDMTTGRAEGHLPSPSYTQRTMLALVASQAGGKEGAQNALNLFLSTQIFGANDAHFIDGDLVLQSR